MTTEPATFPRLECVVLDCRDPRALAEFYGTLLGWKVEPDEERPTEWVALRNPSGGADICFQRDPEFAPPTWPARDRQQMSHLDFTVGDMEAEHRRALEIGARLLDGTPTSFRVYADLEGHPFCLCAC